MKCCHFQNGESEGSKPLNVVQRSFPNNRKKQEQKQKQKLHSLKSRHSLHVCSAKGGKVTGVWDQPRAQVFNVTSDETRREEGSEAWGCREDSWRRRWDRARLEKKGKPHPQSDGIVLQEGVKPGNKR